MDDEVTSEGNGGVALNRTAGNRKRELADYHANGMRGQDVTRIVLLWCGRGGQGRVAVLLRGDLDRGHAESLTCHPEHSRCSVRIRGGAVRGEHSADDRRRIDLDLGD